MAELEFPETHETPEDDAAEQAQTLDPRDDEADRDTGFGAAAPALSPPAEADPADAAEQAVQVPVDEDEYR